MSDTTVSGSGLADTAHARSAEPARPRTEAPARLSPRAALGWLWGFTVVRRAVVLAALAAMWQTAAVWQSNPLLFPTFTDTMSALASALSEGDLLPAALASLAVLIKGYVLAVALALVLVSAAIAVPFLKEVLLTLTAMFNPLPAIALLPLAMLWLGLGEASLLLVMVHAVLWPFALAALTGFEQVPETQRLVGRNYGLKGLSYVALILIPAALPSLLSGLKIAWAFAWRTLIAAELVFGVSSRAGGLGWFIYRNRNELLTDRVFAGLVTVILIGLAVEVLFRAVEQRTVRRWGLQR
ncbi:ABC transporter permease [Xanthobacter oligotrophicus]|uniref:ABC transporter permease n=1 Tax=Xanthobacter oligotrophicus TaxID=2607286 RepID=UPI0011F3C0D8|nr:ABC transporter permease subunit [Xanthobacter oligotrophicus]MCG5236276.1 ABC transporter permease subunit [Xanthobacter oligotrophicus]